jgi:hypothetical protein
MTRGQGFQGYFVFLLNLFTLSPPFIPSRIVRNETKQEDEVMRLGSEIKIQDAKT